MTYLRVYAVDDEQRTRFIREIDGNSPLVEMYLKKATKTAPNIKQNDTINAYIMEDKIVQIKQ